MTTVSFSSKSNSCVYDLPPYINIFCLANANSCEPKNPYILHLLSVKKKKKKRIKAPDPLWKQNSLWVHKTGRKDAWSSDNRLEMGHLHHNSATLYMQFNKWKKYACLCFLVIFHCWLDREMEIYVTCILEVTKRLRLRRQSGGVSDLKISRSLSLCVSRFIAL